MNKRTAWWVYIFYTMTMYCAVKMLMLSMSTTLLSARNTHMTSMNCYCVLLSTNYGLENVYVSSICTDHASADASSSSSPVSILIYNIYNIIYVIL